MNTVENDYGKFVIAVGAPGSMARLKIERPALIARLITQENSNIAQLIFANREEVVKLLVTSSANHPFQIDYPNQDLDRESALAALLTKLRTEDVEALEEWAAEMDAARGSPYL